MIRIRRCRPPATTPQTVALVSNALLPLIGWRDIEVRHEVRQELTALERFVLEMALALGTVTAADFTEVTSLPREVLAAGATRLIAGRALRLVGDTYVVEPETAQQALRDQGVRRHLPATADFVLLPRTGELFVLPSGKKSWLRQLELARITGTGSAPIPQELWSRPRFAYLAACVQTKRARLQDPHVVDVPIPDEDPVLALDNGGARLCAVYTCRAEVTRDDHDQLTIRTVIHGKPARRNNKSGSDLEIPIQLTGAVGLVKDWLELAAGLEDPVNRHAAWRQLCPAQAGEDQVPFHDVRRRGPMDWEFLLTEQAALAIAATHQPLDHPVGLALENDKATVQVVCWFVPADHKSRLLFAVDQAVSWLLTSVDPAKELAAVCESTATDLDVPALDPKAIRERAWDLASYRLVYALRELEDFLYD